MQVPLDRLSFAAHALAVLNLGWMAGFFGTYAINVSPAMLGFDALAYVQAQAAFNRHVRHALFFALFFGPLLWCLLALAAGWTARRRAWWRLLLAVAAAYALGVVFFTREVNLPLNHQTEAWADLRAPGGQWAAVRDAWNAANRWRAALVAGLFALGLGALAWRLRPPGAG